MLLDSVSPRQARDSLRLLYSLPITFANSEAAPAATYKLEKEIFSALLGESLRIFDWARAVVTAR